MYIVHTVALFGALFCCTGALGCLWVLILFHHHTENNCCFMFIWPSLFIFLHYRANVFVAWCETPRQQIKVEDGGE